jgi:SAM-dependent methyltransferase
VRTWLRRATTGRDEKSDAPKSSDAQPMSAAVAGINTYDFSLSDQQIARGVHRKRVGAMWDQIGKHQFDYLVEVGLQPQHRMLDVGCGALRGGIHFVRYLEPGHYYGIDVNESLLRAGLEHEVPAAGLQGRLPAENLRATSMFESDFGIPFDYALAVSVFTHLPLNHIRLCLWQLAKAMPPGGRFLATFFRAPADLPYDEPVQQVAVQTHVERDPFHYRPYELEWAGSLAGWEFTDIGDWGHPRGQQMAEFRRPG